MADPVLPALVVMGIFLPGRSSMKGGGPTPPSDGRWSFPMPAWRGYAPTVSDGYSLTSRGGKGHHGVDIMYRRKTAGADQMYPAGSPNGSKLFFCPDYIVACAARDGTIYTCGEGGHGKFIVIDHGKPFATFYTHLSSVRFPFLKSGSGDIRVKAGDPIGVVGYSPMDREKLMHLHFEVWYRGGASSHVDPWPLLERAPLPTVK